MSQNLVEKIGFQNGNSTSAGDQHRLLEYVNLKLASRGYGIVGEEKDFPFLEMGKSMIANFQERSRLLAYYLCPADHSIDAFLKGYLADVFDEVFTEGEFLVPSTALLLERHGIGRILSLPHNQDRFESSILSSYRVAQGVCHNPAKDRRTTKGVFHVAEGGLPIPFDKKAVPALTFAHLLKSALNPPQELNILPFTANTDTPVHQFVSLLLRPVVSPGVDGVSPKKTSEIRFFAPGSLVANLDFVESIFGNAGDPYLPENDARLDPEHWSGHTGCVILAPHLIRLRKQEVGLPHINEASDRQKRDGMCWEDKDELYNNGGAFKITCRTAQGFMVTLIADNYFGYCKKEVKTQISFAANLLGNTEEEHAGGAIALPSFDLGESFSLSEYNRPVDHTWAEVVDRFSEIMDLQPEGYGIDRTYPDIIYVPEDVHIDLHQQKVSWTHEGGPREIMLRPNHTYVLPSGYRVEMVKPSTGQRWRLRGTTAEGTFCHKPCTVSGGGKSEISKSLADAMITGPVIVSDFHQDIERAAEIISRDFGDRYKKPTNPEETSRPLLSPERSLGSVVRLLTPRADYTDEYNAWLASLPRSVKELVFIIKRFYKPDWGDTWRERFTVDTINGEPGHELKYRRQRLVTQYLRVGFSEDGTWRTFGLRKDFFPAKKIQTEDDISASIVLPADQLKGLHPELDTPSHKFVTNCEYRLFQRPDDAIHRGYDKKTEKDFSRHDVFFSNYEPLTRSQVEAMVQDSIRFEYFTKPIRELLRNFAKANSPEYVISSSNPRLVDGKETKNPRYLQNRDDLENPRDVYLARTAGRLYRRLAHHLPLHLPVTSTLSGRRNNPAEPGIRPLAVYNPIHYQELPELFMDYVASLTGKSPSTTGAGSEGALTKGPFNALLPVHDLNNALVSYLLTHQHGFSTAAGYIGSKYKVDHDISLLVPEVWSRMFIHERKPDYLIQHGFLEQVKDFEHEGKSVWASRLGYRITEAFVSTFFNRVFSDPSTVLPPDMLRPELQNLEEFVDGVNNIVETQQRVASHYFEDDSIDRACPPLAALLHIMAHGHWNGKKAQDSEFRKLFTRQSLVESDWYRERLERAVAIERKHLQNSIPYLEAFLKKSHYSRHAESLGITKRLQYARDRNAELGQEGHSNKLVGMIGADAIE